MDAEEVGHQQPGIDHRPRRDAAGTYYFNGTLDDVRIYSRTLTPNEVYALANPTVVTIAATVKNALEVGQTNGTFTVSRTGSTGIPMNVYYAVSGPATNGTDHTTLPGYVTIPAGQPSATITVVPVDDNLIEGDENVVLTLDNAANNYTVGSRQAHGHPPQ